MSQNYDKCFVCGAANPIGLQLSFSYDEAGHAHSEVVLNPHFEGYPELIHGGIVSTLLDEVMAKAVIHSGKNAVTAKLQINFRRAVNSQTKLYLEGWICESKTRTLKTAARIYDAAGNFAEAEAIFIVPKP